MKIKKTTPIYQQVAEYLNAGATVDEIIQTLGINRQSVHTGKYLARQRGLLKPRKVPKKPKPVTDVPAGESRLVMTFPMKAQESAPESQKAPIQLTTQTQPSDADVFIEDAKTMVAIMAKYDGLEKEALLMIVEKTIQH
jgi:transposase-like protein